MKRVAVSKLKASLSEYLSGVKGGEEVMVTDRGIPVARLVPINTISVNEDGLYELAKTGLVRLPEKGPEELPELFKKKHSKGSIMNLLLKEREQGW